MRSFDELMATDYVIDWTPQEMYQFVMQCAKNVGELKQSFAREKLAHAFVEIQTNAMKAMQNQSLAELQAVREQATRELQNVIDGVYDYEQQ